MDGPSPSPSPNERTNPDGRVPHAGRALRGPAGLHLRAALRRGRRPAPAPPRRGQGSTVALLPRRAELELPVPAHARRPGGERSPGRVPGPRRLRPLRQAHRPALVHVRPPRRDGQPPPRRARPARRHGRRPGLGRSDRPALGRRARRPRRAAGRAEHRPLHRTGQQGLHGLARLRRAHPRPAHRADHPGRHDDRAAARDRRGLRRALSHAREQGGRAALPAARAADPGRRRRGRDGRRARRARRLGQAGARRLLRQRPGVPLPAAGEQFTALLPTAGEQVRIEGAAHFLQEDRGAEIAEAMLAAFGEPA